ncbi:hypothetical protein CKAH01_01294 [Colletotrichum kahawae]|uniref:Uncharacterized protein n=1 Tax=Colletotrichum kahawae TaxID=34407 RepID=A0AAD9YD02_COLKA|nr:hypothetical protein CKAH01_01294 [Colletotrichum kahawae]
MSDPLSNHKVPLSAAPGQTTETDRQETVNVNEDVTANITEGENDIEITRRTDSGYNTVPTSDTGSLTSGEETAIDSPITGECQRKPPEPTEKLEILRSWLFEFLAVFISIFSYAGIIAVLGAYNGQPQPEFARDVNINTIIAILSTTLRAATAFIATEVIGQSKWEWLETPRPLRHFEHLDNAGRGAWGSIKFLFFVSKPTLAIIGALLMMTSYIIDPFSQQLAKTYSCNIAYEDKASIAVARRFKASSRIESPSIWAAAMSGLTYGVAENTRSQLFQCPSGNCTFPMRAGISHTSVGMCSTCTDVTSGLMEKTTTSIISFSAASCAKRVGGGYVYNKTTCRMMKPDGIKGTYANWQENIGIVAVNCSLSPCLRRYSGEISHGSLKEKPVSQEPMDYGELDMTVEGYTYHSWSIKLLEPCEVDGRWYDSSNITEVPKDSTWISWKNRDNSRHEGPRDCVMGMRSDFIGFIASFQNVTIQGDRNFFDRTTDPMSIIWLSAVDGVGNATLETISAAFDGMATGYTDFMRNDGKNADNDCHNVLGTAYKSAVCIRADWPWLVYPGVLLVSTTVLLVAAFISSMRGRGKQPVWKSAILPLLFYNLTTNQHQHRDQADQNDMEVPLLQIKELEALADKTMARFSVNAAAPGFIIENRGTICGDASAGQQVGLLRRLSEPRAD